MMKKYLYSIINEPLDETELWQYFGESQTTTATGYVFIYCFEGFEAETILKQLAPLKSG